MVVVLTSIESNARQKVRDDQWVAQVDEMAQGIKKSILMLPQ